ncbi:condensation domain-containing protein [Chitinophaga nivalis]|uniref:Condensation domain-containing protein n=1 Tax=Chitinophaga nivalis TaxID=2991709 RepID=A0ABT3IKC7_9BACT|nr:condensation domain-containing protein [Chitinophaga nivalis]MCW3465931.1 condensation domain-containing protein [Chitinophaga nivalis]MCW3484378.1 condensation domain-containing protein [Chitinophaga nivalis]
MILDLIRRLNENNIGLSLSGSHLEVNYDGSSLPEALLKEIRDHKTAIISFLQQLTPEAIIPAAPQTDDYPLSVAQQRLWTSTQMKGGAVAYNMSSIYSFEEELRMEVLTQVFDAMLERHESLRTVFRSNSAYEIRQVILAREAIDFNIRTYDLRETAHPATRVKAMVREELSHAFDLEKGPLIRGSLYRTATQQWILVVVIHHLIADGKSMEVLMTELFQLYDAYLHNKEVALPPLSIHYKDYAVWEAEQLRDGERNVSEQYWHSRFEELPALLELPVDKPRPAVRSYSGDKVIRGLSPLLVKDFKAFLQEQDATLFMGLLALLNALLYRYCRQEDIVVGCSVAGRTHAALQGQIGLYANTIALRTRFSSGESFAALLQQVKEVVLGGLEHQSYPFYQLLRVLNLQKDPSRNPLFDVGMVLHTMRDQPSGKRPDDLQDLQDLDTATSKFELFFDFVEQQDELVLRLEYSTDIYYSNAVVNLATQLERLMAAILEAPQQSLEDLSGAPVARRYPLPDVSLLRKTNYRQWIHYNRAAADRLIKEGEFDFWVAQCPAAVIPARQPTRNFRTGVDIDSQGNTSTEVQHIIIAGMVQALSKVLQVREIVIEREGHGRNTLAGYDVSSNVGWFTSKFPLKYTVENDSIQVFLEKVKALNNAVPNAGVGYGVLRYLSAGNIGRRLDYMPHFSFNFLGELSGAPATGERKGLIRSAHYAYGAALEQTNKDEAESPYWLDLNAWLDQGMIRVGIVVNREMGLTADELERFNAILTTTITTMLAGPVAEALTPFQQGLVSFVKNNPESSRYVVQYAFRINEVVHFNLFHTACSILTARHEILRTAYDFDEDTGRFIARLLPEEAMLCTSLEIAPEEDDRSLLALLQQIQHDGFDISRTPLIRYTLVNTGPHACVVAVTMHHIIMDGSAATILFHELLSILTTLKAGNMPEKILPGRRQFSHYVHWLYNQDRQAAVTYWRKLLQDTAPAEMKTIGETMAAAEEFGTWEGDYPLHPECLELLKAEGITLSAACNLLTGLVLSKYIEAAKFVWGNMVSLRPPELSEMEYIIGPCIASIPVVADFHADQPLGVMMKALQLQVLQSREQAFLPLHEMVAGTGYPQLFHVLFTFQNYNKVQAGITYDISPVGNEVRISSHFPLTVMINEMDQALNIKLSFRKDMFAVWVLQDITRAIMALLNNLPVHFNSMVSAIGIHDTACSVPSAVLRGIRESDEGKGQTLHGCFGEVVKRCPENIAVIVSDTTISYLELDQMSNYVAAQLLKEGVTGAVGLRMKRSPGMVAAVIGVLKAGCYVVGLDKHFPEDRLLWIGRELGMTALVYDTPDTVPAGFAQAFCLPLEEHIPLLAVPPVFPVTLGTDLCTINYTSGSTGVPKMVLIDHASHLNRINWLQTQFPAEGHDRYCLRTALSFAPALREIFEPLLQGAALCILPDNFNEDMRVFVNTIQEQHITRLFLTPTYLQLLLDEGKTASLQGLRNLEVSGEPAQSALIGRLREALPDVHILNRYGATEAASVVYHMLAPENRLREGNRYFPLGKPVRNTTVYVVNNALQPVPRGVVGEILIESMSRAKGYVNQQGEEGVFTEITSGGGKVLRTGDLGFVNEDGLLCYYGRKNRMLKVRGFRVEPREIEYNAELCPGVGKAVVLPVETVFGQRIQLYYSPEAVAEPVPAGSVVRAFLSKRLPSYMDPHEVIPVEKIPLTANGKIDYMRLRALAATGADHQDTDAQTETAQILTAILRSLLGAARFDVYTDFFEIGLDSILALRAIYEIKRSFGLSIAVSALYRYSNISTLATLIDAQQQLSKPALPGHTLLGEGEGNRLLFVIPPAGLNAFIFLDAAPYLPKKTTAIVFDPADLTRQEAENSTLESVATGYLEEILRIAAGREVNIMGWSLGATLAFEVARQLEGQGVKVPLLILIDPGFSNHSYDNDFTREKLQDMLQRMIPVEAAYQVKEELLTLLYNANRLIRDYQPGAFRGDICLVKPAVVMSSERNYNRPFNGMDVFCSGEIKVVTIAGNHMTMMDQFFRDPDISNSVFGSGAPE